MIIKLLGALVLIGICIFIHELGHLLMGMLVGAKAKVFSLGYGRGIWKKEWNGTTYQITAIPLGGYVQFYGHDYTQPLTYKGGEFMALPPLKRIIPVLGGPLFNLLLGALIYFILSMTGLEVIPNKIEIPENQFGRGTPAYRQGLKTGDRILAVNGEPTGDFMKVRAAVALSDPDKPIKLLVERDGEKFTKEVTPYLASFGQRPFIGIGPPTKRHIRVRLGENDNPASIHPLMDGDTIRAINEKQVTDFESLVRILRSHAGETVRVTVERNTVSEFNPWHQKKIVVEKPVKTAWEIEFDDITDLKYPSLEVPPFEFVTTQPNWRKNARRLKVNGKHYDDEAKLRAELEKLATAEERPRFALGTLDFQARVKVKPRGLLGIPVIQTYKPISKAVADPGFGERMKYVGDRISSNIRLTWESLLLLVRGKVSAKDSLGGPIEIAKLAGDQLERGWKRYFEFMAYISIILMLMNLLPLPIVDGGNIVFFLLEAIRGKPLPVPVMDLILRLGFVFLLGLGVFVMVNDTIRNFF